MHASIHEGHLSTSLCHLANISYRTGKSLTFTGETERFVDAPDADALLRRTYRAPYVVPESV